MHSKDPSVYLRLCSIAVVAPLDVWGTIWMVQTFGWRLFWEAWIGLAVFVVFPLGVVCWSAASERRSSRVRGGR